MKRERISVGDRARLKAAGCAWVLATLVAASGTAVAQVTPSGTTATRATIGAGGQINVSIATPNGSGVSLNQYSAFSVPRPGVNLLNQGVNASTIINQVTSNNRSILNGPLTVVGPTAHVVLVNPSGITVDGGSFVNTGGVALSTGPLSFTPSQNTVLGTGTGDILVAGQGLTGSTASLQLIAGRIRIDGPVSNTSSAPNANINVVAGNAQVVLDSSLLPGSTLTPWATTTKQGGAAGGVLVDVTPNGSLSASRVSMVVSAQGAGVSFQGRGNASIGEFTIDANGRVAVLGGQIQAEKDVKITAPAIDVLNAGSNIGQITSTTGAVTLLASSGDINITGQINGNRRNGADPDSLGGVTLNASGSISLLSENANRLAIVFSSRDDLSVTAGGDITNNTGRLLSNNAVSITAGGTFSNIEDVVSASSPVTYSSGFFVWWWPFWGGAAQSFNYNFGSLRIYRQVANVVGASVSIRAAQVINSGDIIAQVGALEIDTGLFEDIGIASGSAAFARNCFFFCHSGGYSTVVLATTETGAPAGLVSSAGSMRINASVGIVNDGGTILSNGNLALNSPSIAANGLLVPQAASLPGGLYNAFSGPGTFLYLQPVGGVFQAPNGRIDITSTAPVAINGGALQAGGSVNAPMGLNTIVSADPQSDLANWRFGILGPFW